MTNRTNADFFQVLLRRAREDPFVYLVIAERSLILSKAKAPQPNHNVHDGGLTLPSTHDRPNDKGCPAQVLSVSGHMTPSHRGRDGC
jgi:hypothetical protein